MRADANHSSTAVADGFLWRKKGELSFLVCDPLERAGFVNAFSARAGGVSPFPENALNLSVREDKKENVAENRRRFLGAAQAESIPLMTVFQTHSDKTVTVSSAMEFSQEPEADAMVSSLKGVVFGIQTADCLPVLIGDADKGVVAAIHAGWRGTMARITEKAITQYMKSLGTKPESCWVALGPSACGECYEVGSDVLQAFKSQFPESVSFFKDIKENGKAFLDVRAANYQQLITAGVPSTQIFASSYCTIHDNDLFFSYRSESKGGAFPVGRQLSIIGRK